MLDLTASVESLVLTYRPHLDRCAGQTSTDIVDLNDLVWMHVNKVANDLPLNDEALFMFKSVASSVRLAIRKPREMQWHQLLARNEIVMKL